MHDSAPDASSRNRPSSRAEDTASTSTSTVDQLPNSNSPSRRRRLMHRLSRPWSLDSMSSSASSSGRRSPPPFNPDANNHLTFNSDANDFVPARAPSKRKASASTRTGKSFMSMPRVHTYPVPQIHSEDVFGKGALSRSPTDQLFRFHENDDHSDIFDFDLPDSDAPLVVDSTNHPTAHSFFRAPRQRAAYQAALYGMSEEKPKRPHEPIQSHSAILYCRESRGGSADADGQTSRLKYLPLCPVTSAHGRDGITKDTHLTVLPEHKHLIDETVKPKPASRARWPPHELPVEIFDLITAQLSRDHVKSMRLVNREFEQKVSATLFASTVVPFNTELYDMIDEQSKIALRSPRLATAKMKGKGKARAVEPPEPAMDAFVGGLQWQNAKDDAEGKVYKGHGLRVFQGFGPHMKKFGMSFEVAETQLARPPIKKELDHVDSYHGSYDWPHHNYTRFANLAGLERTADETLRMKSAFSHLRKVQDLGLSIDNGLGWLNGPDKSIHARIFQRASRIFGQTRPIPDQQMHDAQKFWAAIQASHQSLGIQGNPKELFLARRPLHKPPTEIPGLEGTRYANPHLWSSIGADRAIPAMYANDPNDNSSYGLLYTTFTQPDLSNFTIQETDSLVPAELRKEQREWLMETDWAQRAFLESYMLAIIDNPLAFGHVKTLTISKISSGFLPILSRDAFWEALPGLTDVTLHVKPDWRAIERDNAGLATASQRHPSESVDDFYRCILRERLLDRPKITTLNIGWAAGGEHADGLFARNNHILPAPISDLQRTTAPDGDSDTVFRFVEHLILTNCWITPPALERLVMNHADKPLKKLTLNSVSLTAHPKFAAGGQGAMQQVMQALHALPAGHQPNPAVPPQNHHHHHNNAPPPWQQMMHLHHANLAAHQQQPPPPPGPVLGGGPHAHPGIAQPPNIPAPAQVHITGAHPSTTTTSSHWALHHREGSWAHVLNIISPGPTLDSYVVQPPQTTTPHPPLLHTLELISCGYAKLPHNTTFDQFVIEAGAADHHLSSWFRARQAALLPAMLSTPDRYLAKIVQHVPDRERDALRFAWRFHEGWPDPGRAEEPEYDGLLRGGTGRFSGVIERGGAVLL